jgi:hypothetical protein
MTDSDQALPARDALQQALNQSLAVPSGPGRSEVLGDASEGGNFLTRLFEDGEDKRHRSVQKVTSHVATEAVQAQVAIGIIAGNYFDTALETEYGFEQTILQYRGSQLAMSAAPGHAQAARAVLASGLGAIGDAAVRHISKKISGR